MKLSILMPVYNEKDTILQILDKVERVQLPVDKEIILIDDCSTDGTRDILRKIKKYKVFFHQKNGGKGTAIRTGLQHATGDIIAIQDGDLEYDPEAFKKLIQPILDGETKVVYGSRFLSQNRVRYQLYYLGNIFLSFLTRLLYGVKITDMETCYKVFTADVLRSITLRARRFDLEPEITAKFIKKGHSILELPIKYTSRAFTEGKKITWRDGMQAAYYLLKYRFVN